MQRTFILLLAAIISLPVFPCQAQDQISDVGNFYPFLDTYSQNHRNSMSFLSKDWKNTETWRSQARAKMNELLAFNPESAPLNTEILETEHRDGYTQYLVRYNLNTLQKTEAYLLIPDNLEEPAPAVVALHDHGGFYYFGKEKHNRTDDQPKILKEYVQKLYDGRYYADELAKRGYVVLSPDAIFFGSQRIEPEKITPDRTEEYFEQANGNINEKIQAFNELAGDHEEPMEKTILTAGTTWPGIIVQNDKRAVDLLLSRPEVDSGRIAAMGLSLGGLRTTYLFGMDPRIKVGIIGCFSSTYEEMLQRHLHHTWMMYVPQQYQFLDMPDVASLNAPNPLLIMNTEQDKLFSLNGMKAAKEKLSGIYQKMGAPKKFKANFYDVPHSMPIPMQEDAFTWLDKWLK
ncbi:dienelactone hydrolase family protein [Aliifodinibius sp. S!AR15-10]|uniref:dienelactone hydrolase family protein n=1 Tax=Aliifodinibius sp. S!AR15-10 TaxID=2950437 RepID=UPI0028613518|nr:alpha/beta hydrolase family protein [Aliifodinibius sp. S!AR15-10]MDR8392725.1 dienelactone hydrolase family protein [Aliifodinibius sp. S!AR15-10]